MRADDPKTLLGWWWRGAIEKEKAVVIASLGVVGGLVLTLAGAGWALFLVPLGFLPMIVGALTDGARGDLLSTMLPDPPLEGQFRATAIYSCGGLSAGKDEVALTVVDGWLIGEGLRSEFALRPSDVVKRTKLNAVTSWIDLTDGSTIRLGAIGSAGREVIENWAETTAQVAGEPTYPPARVHPQEFARWRAYLLCGTFLAGVGAFINQTGWAGFALRQGIWLLGVVLVLISGRRWWRLMRLDYQVQKELMAPSPTLPACPPSDA